ncbi:MAG: hypothetical protein GIW95_10185 [Candidatus Eremiobacteraeota bacterium]|nr:hypothetical protein [Candidatus Eremiobacteraeota bacterium]
MNRADLEALVSAVDEFYVRNRRLEAAQRTIKAKLAAAAGPGAPDIATYVAEVRRYFSGFEREARAHLKDVERRLAQASQLQFNLTAERGVAARRVEITQGVLSRLAEPRPQ